MTSNMMTSSYGNIFCVTGPLWGESTRHRWITFTKPVTRSSDVFFGQHRKKKIEQAIETQVIWDAIALIMTSLQRTPGVFSCERGNVAIKINGRLIEAWTKWVTVCRKHFQMQFYKRKVLAFRLGFHWSLFPDPIDNKSKLIQVIAWRWIGNRRLPERMLTTTADEIWCHRPQWVKVLISVHRP